MIFRLILISICLFLTIWIYPKTPRFDYHPAAQLIRQNMQNGQGFVGVGITSKSEVWQFFIDPETRKWSVVGIDSGLRTKTGCTLITGTNWRNPGEVDL